ncbi:toprim domain-containing protein [Nitratireductor aquimarinus]|uniref:toprim domain-containing protein n=1 Tax=Nitratireductor TaxID=245876 RepID=UPI0019D348D6|nr:toprim domain-containing protein [Nitratireductor aquimarinus]MBN7777752.1 toprim domain-containing protein [Nitratireductor pacificus]MBN7781746.1 toprim domain-containing protein [Nitratireductor pacificus]MBN7790552.1 toprim domain-containing protein [Nitratireductor aquimarinus]MBY6099962.1 toprim domain-containing protein [Nitratireductor aquimarinus]MCA1260428.1 toprim domain-containing protein [Nitratireductor aquimarinus]
MNIEDALSQACDQVGIRPPRTVGYGKWLLADTLDGKRGKGDGRVMMTDHYVTAFNWKTGQKATVSLTGQMDVKQQRRIAHDVRAEKERQKARAERAARTASNIVDAAQPAQHPYLVGKGFPDEKALVIDAEYLKRHVGDYLVCGERAIVMPARFGSRVTSVQLIWEDGTKKFLAGGEIGGSCDRIGKGADTWLCEGLATGLSLRAALKGLRRADTILCCFSASNVAQVARSVKGRTFIAADHDKPVEQFGWKGTGEYYAEAAGKPYFMPPDEGTDINDFHMEKGIFALQKLVATFLRRAGK